LISLERSHRVVPLALELVAGMTLPTGYLSPNFVAPGGSRTIELTDPAILLTDREISAQEDLVPLLDALVRQDRRDLLVMAADVAGAALALLTANAAAGVLRCVAVRAPEVNEYRTDILEDLAIWTGARFVSTQSGDRLASVTPADLGCARSVHIDDETTVIVGGQGDPENARRRVAAVKAAAQACADPYKKEKMDRRVARLSGGVAVIWYGGATDAERNERRLRLEDAVAGLWAALRGGVVPGGGAALLNAARRLNQLEVSGDEAAGVRIVGRAMAEPLRQIADNAGSQGSMVVATVGRLQQERDNPSAGYDAVAGDYCDLSERGIMDPAEVVIAALETAVSGAAMALTTEAIVLPAAARRPPATRTTSSLSKRPGS
jgi:chaperonin GroEL